MDVQLCTEKHASYFIFNVTDPQGPLKTRVLTPFTDTETGSERLITRHKSHNYEAGLLFEPRAVLLQPQCSFPAACCYDPERHKVMRQSVLTQGPHYLEKMA